MGLQLFYIRFVTQPPLDGDSARAFRCAFSVEWKSTRLNGSCNFVYSANQLRPLLEFLDACHREDSVANEAEPSLAAVLGSHGMLNAGELVRDPGKAIGIYLFDILFRNEHNEQVLTCWNDFWASVQGAEYSDEDEWRIVLWFSPTTNEDFQTAILMALPWEALWDAKGDNNPLVAGRHNVTIVREYSRGAYRPSQTASEPHAPVPAVLALSPPLDDYATQQSQALPQIWYDPDDLTWCDVLVLQGPLLRQRLESSLNQHQPQIVHYFGHGGLAQSEFSFLLEEERTTAYDIWRLFNPNLQLLVSFACYSGSTVARADDGVIQTSRVDTLIDRLAPLIPALLTMQMQINAEAAAVASETIYRRLGVGDSLEQAVRALRQELYVRYRAKELWLRCAWWVPALYVRNAANSVRLYDRQKRREAWALPHDYLVGKNIPQYDMLIAQIERMVDAGEHVIPIEAAQHGGKSIFLAYLAQYRRERSLPFLAFRSPKGQENIALYVQDVQREIIARIFQRRGPRRDDSSDERRYDMALQSDCADLGAPLYVLIDDFDHVDAAALLPVSPPCIVFVVTRRPTAQPAAPVVLTPLDSYSLQLIHERTFDNYLVDTDKERGEKPEFQFFEYALFGSALPLEQQSVQKIVEAWLSRVSGLMIPTWIKQLASKGYLHCREEDGRYEPHYQGFYTEWYKQFEPGLYVQQVVPMLKAWRDEEGKHGVADYPSDLLRVLAHPCHSEYIAPFSPVLPLPQHSHPGTTNIEALPHFELWDLLATRYSEANLQPDFDRLVKCCDLHRQRHHLFELDIRILRLLSECSKHSPPMRLPKPIWWHNANVGLKPVAVSAERAPSSGLEDVAGVTQSALNDLAPVEQVVDRLREFDVDERCFALRFVVMPLLLRKEDKLEAMIKLLFNLSNKEKVAIGSALVAPIPRSQPFFKRACALLDSLILDPTAIDDAAELFIALLPSLKGELRDEYARKIASDRSWPNDPFKRFSLLSEELVLRYCSVETAPTNWRSYDATQEVDEALVLFGDEVLGALSARPLDPGDQALEAQEAVLKQAEAVLNATLAGLPSHTARRLHIGTYAAVVRSAQLLGLSLPTSLALQIVRLPFSSVWDSFTAAVLAPFFSNDERLILGVFINVIKRRRDEYKGAADLPWSSAWLAATLQERWTTPSLAALWFEAYNRVARETQSPETLLLNNGSDDEAISRRIWELEESLDTLLDEIISLLPMTPTGDARKKLNHWRDQAVEQVKRIINVRRY